MRFDVLTLFPEMLHGYLGQSLLKLAIQRKLIDVQLHNLRDWATGKHKQVDDRPFGGGPGMVLMVEPVVRAVEAVREMGTEVPHLVMLTPQGKTLNQEMVERLATYPRLLLLCGRYEGFDERVRKILQPEEISIGDFILGGGEVASMVVIDAVSRLIPGVLGDEQSNREDSFSGSGRLLEFAQYTRPREFEGHDVPEILFSGDHGKIAAWREKQSIERTEQRRPDLLTPGSALTNPSDNKDH